MRYIVEAYGSYDEPMVREIIRTVRPEEENAMMSQFAQDIIAKGKPEWKREGRQEEGASILTRLLQRRFGAIPAWAGEKIAKAEPATLEEWTLRILDAPTIESVLADPS